MNTFARWYLYPLLWCWVAACTGWALAAPEATSMALAAKAAGLVGVLLLFEWLTPLRGEWGMTWRHLLRRDLVMVLVNGACVVAINYGLLLLAIRTSAAGDGVMGGQPLALQVLVGLFAFESLQYSIHRLMHVSKGPISNFLWRSHAIHHLPAQLYLVMHAVFHPINAVIVRVLVQLTPIWLLGFDPEAVLVYGAIIAFHGTISHLNVDLRLGWLNYVFVGPELHRYHHSANSHEAKNFAATLACFDVVLGTFHYQPGEQPAALGLREVDGYPGQHAPIRALLFPFQPAAVPAENEAQLQRA